MQKMSKTSKTKKQVARQVDDEPILSLSRGMVEDELALVVRWESGEESLYELSESGIVALAGVLIFELTRNKTQAKRLVRKHGRKLG